jgi:hypothetical protein
MAKTKEVKVKSYVRKDGTRVNSASRTIEAKKDRKGRLKRPQKLSGHLAKGMKIGAAIDGGANALVGAVIGGVIGGPVGAVSVGTLSGISGGIRGGVIGGAAGTGVYGAKRVMAKKRDPKGFKGYFDYSRDADAIEFRRGRGKDKKKRKKRQNKLSNHIRKGALASTALGTLGLIAVARKNPGLIIGALPGTLIGGAVYGSVLGAGTYGVKKLAAKDRSKRNFDYSKFKNGERQLMFIGKNEDGAINYARTPGARDKSPRQKRNQMFKNVAKGAAVVGAGVAAVKNRKAISGLASKGYKSAGSAIGKGRQKVGSALENKGSAMQRRAGYARADAVSRQDPTKKGMMGKIRDIEKSASKNKRGQQLREIGKRIRGGN